MVGNSTFLGAIAFVDELPPLRLVYIGGFFFAVLLRLFVVPVLYDTFARAAEWFHRAG